MTSLPLPSEVVAAVTDDQGSWLGTAFFVGPTTALTCAHVVNGHSKDKIKLLPVGGSAPIPVEELTVRDMHDLARLDVTHNMTSWLPLKREWTPGARVVSHGFSNKYPGSRFPYGHPMDPCEISGETDVEWPSGRAKVLRLTPSNADSGFSGGPAVDVASGAVLGILRFRLPGEGGTYAIPSSIALSDWPDLTTDLQRRPNAAEANPLSGSWLSFDPRKFQCVVIDSEIGRRDHVDSLLSKLMRETMSQDGILRVWNAFRNYWSTRILLRGRAERELAVEPVHADLRLATVNVRDAYSSRARLAETIRLIVESDVALFDVTNFEPGAMLLMGVRAAARRGITIASHGTWVEGSPIPRPFNLNDLPLVSHILEGTPVGPDPRVDLLVERIVEGFKHMDSFPRYLDLPAHDGIRFLGPSQAAWSTVGLERMVLVLCSYDKAFYYNWRNVRSEIRTSLSESNLRPQVARLVDLRKPQLVSQALYEMIRRCSACVTDWTGWSPSTFFELGVRLSISPWGSVQIVDDQWLNDVEGTAEGSVILAQANDTEETPKYPFMLDQTKSMREIFEPIGYYGKGDSSIGTAVARELMKIRNTAGVEGGHFIRSVVLDSIIRVQEARPEIYAHLAEEANALHHTETQQVNTPQALFPEITDFKTEQENAALQRRIAAWLYLDSRLDAGSLPEGDARKEAWRSLGNTVLDALHALAEEEDQWLIAQMERKLGPGPVIARLRQKGDALRDRGDLSGAHDAWGDALRKIDDKLKEMSIPVPSPSGEINLPRIESQKAPDVAELFGNRGGLSSRLDKRDEALQSYRAGAVVESRYGLVSTYNRTNAIKLALASGIWNLAEAQSDLLELRGVLEHILTTDEGAADNAWLWADLADVRLLLGDTQAAEEAYRVFTRKAETRSPSRALAVIRKITNALVTAGDPQAEPLMTSIGRIEAALGSA